MIKIFKKTTETSQGAEPLWCKETPSGLFKTGRYEESEEFRIVTHQYNVYHVFGVRIWTSLVSKVIDESEWYTTSSYAKKMGYGE